MASRPTKSLETFANPRPGRDYEIRFDCPEFTCLCPLTGQPDFATFQISYVPDELCIELKSLKLYLWSFRDEGAFHEKVTNQIADDIIAAIKPRRLRVEGDFAFQKPSSPTTLLRPFHSRARLPVLRFGRRCSSGFARDIAICRGERSVIRTRCGCRRSCSSRPGPRR